MEESPVSLKTLASLEAQANDAYSCYIALTKASTKFRDGGMNLCKTKQVLATSLAAPGFGGEGPQTDICAALEDTVGLLRSLYSTQGRKPALQSTHDTMAAKRKENDTAQRKHHDTLHKACTMKPEDTKRDIVDQEAYKRKMESEDCRLAHRHSLEQGMMAIRQEHTAMLAATLFSHASNFKAIYEKLDAMLPVVTALQDSLSAEQQAMRARQEEDVRAALDTRRGRPGAKRVPPARVEPATS